MTKIRVINRENVKKLITVKDAVMAVEKAYREKSGGKGSVWPMVFHDFDTGHADLDIKSGDLAGSGIFGFKLVSWFDSNPKKNLPELFGTAMIFDITTGEPKALINASALTGFRTGAAAAIGAKYLARKDSETLLMVGCGMLARYAISAALTECPTLKRVIIANPYEPERAVKSLDDIKTAVKELTGIDADIKTADDFKKAVGCADIIITGTPAREPLIMADWVRPGTHISCLGADMHGKEELDPYLLKKARLYADDRHQTVDVGESEMAVKAGIITADHVEAEIGEVILGKAVGRLSDSDITVFDSSGIALQDIAACDILLQKAEKLNIGDVIDL